MNKIWAIREKPTNLTIKNKSLKVQKRLGKNSKDKINSQLYFIGKDKLFTIIFLLKHRNCYE